MRSAGSFSIVVTIAVVCLLLVHAQECPLPEREDLEGNGGLLSAALGVISANLLSEPSVVCLASAPTRDQYRFASVLVSFSRDDSTTVEFGQLDLECMGSQEWSPANIDLTPMANSSTSLRKDCAACVPISSDPEYDGETHCLREPMFALFTLRISNICMVSSLLWLHNCWSWAVH